MATVMEIDDRVLAAKFAVILPHLDERQRRLLLAAEARSLGHGGVTLVARAAGVSRVTVTAGVDELDSGAAPFEEGRARRAGGGRKPSTEIDPGRLQALDDLVKPVTRGDPMTRLRWTTASTRQLADELAALGAQGLPPHRGAAVDRAPAVQSASQLQDPRGASSTPTVTGSSATSTTRSPPV